MTDLQFFPGEASDGQADRWNPYASEARDLGLSCSLPNVRSLFPTCRLIKTFPEKNTMTMLHRATSLQVE
jgi:hypothetical protein